MYFIIFDASGLAVGSGYTDDGSLPDGAQVCTAEAAERYDRYAYVDGGIVEAPPPPVPAPTADVVLLQRDALLISAALRVAPLEDAIDLGVETPEEVSELTAWKEYRVALNRIEQQDGFPADVEWPVAPQ